MVNYYSISINHNKFIFFLRSVLEYIFLLLIILRCSSMYLVMEPFYDGGNSWDNLLNLLFKVLIALIIVNVFIEGIHISYKQVIAAAVMELYFLIYQRVTTFDVAVFNREYVSVFFLIFALCCIASRRDFFTEMWEKYANIALCLAILSLIFYFGGEMFHIFSGEPMQFLNAKMRDGRSYYNLYFVNFMQNRPFLGHRVVRNVGVFMEAPGFALPLSFTLWWELFNGKRVNKLRVAILTITMLTTFSMKAYLMLFVLFAIYIWLHGKELGFTFIRSFMVISGFFAVLLVLFYVGYINGSLFMDMGSVSWRLQDTIAAFLTWLEYPIWGCGFSNKKILYTHFIDAKHAGYTAGLFNVMAYGGIVLLILYFTMLAGYLKVQHKYFVRNLIFVLMFVTFLFMTSMQYQFFTIFIIANGLAMLTSAYQADENGQMIKRDKVTYKI